MYGLVKQQFQQDLYKICMFEFGCESYEKTLRPKIIG